MYNFLTVHRPAPDTMAAALARVMGVPVPAVDVADQDGDQDGRDWEAPVLCGYEVMPGDLALAWDVWVSDAVPEPPDEATTALRLAAATGTTVLYPALDLQNPSAYWAATPEGVVTRARVYESDDDEPGCTVDAVQAPVPQLPGARVELFPEVFYTEKIAVPATEAFVAATDPDGIAPAQSQANRAREVLMLWEKLVRRVEADWGPSGRYPEGLYLEDLRTRDDLAERLAAAPPALREPFARAAGELDDVFRAHTVEDGGELLGRLTKSGAAVKDRGWWWHRRPVRVPWD
ncbi:hypothetical protein ACWGI8_00045 [Streptomyces sp. NPDC054841]